MHPYFVGFFNFSILQEKSLASARNLHFERRDEHSKARGSPLSPRDARDHRPSPETSHMKKSKMSDKDADPSEVLWIGFPAQLKVDEFVLRKAFSPFGEIEKITTFPGRTYAFVRFRKVMAACRAKETLQGKLFGNPRVHICFAKSDSGTSNRERSSINGPPSPHVGSYERAGSFERFQHDRNFGIMPEDPGLRSPYTSNLDPGDRNIIGRDNNLWSGSNDALERRRYLGQGPDMRLPGNVYEHPDSPLRNYGGARMREFSPPSFPRQGPIYDDPWGLPEDVSLLPGSKKLKTSSFPPENDLPEYPFSDLDKAKHILPHDIPQSESHEKMYDSRNSGYRPVPERLSSITPAQVHGERDDHWSALRDDYQAGSMPPLPVDRRRLSPERRESSSKEVWKWEGVIAKGGNPICRARCFPVGKPPDMVLPEYLDCTARTTLDMLSKHYYQAVSAWVVFFVPANDPDISYYNEFMNYLGDRQRAAVAKLNEATTLFLVPPSDFSEKVLKVPGKLSISGVVLRLDTPGSSFGSLPQQYGREPTFQSDLQYQKPISPQGHYLSHQQFVNDDKSVNLSSGSVSAMQPGTAQGHDYARQPNWSAHDMQTSNVAVKTSATVQPPSNLPPPPSMDHPYSAMASRNYTPDNTQMSGNSKFSVSERPSMPASTPLASFPAEQVAQLASSLLGQQGQLVGMAGSAEYAPLGNINQSSYPYNMAPPNYEMQNDHQVPSEFAQQQQQYSQVQQQLPPPPPPPQMNQQFQNGGGGQDDGEGDPQKRLQATLQLAAALLQQIQQGKGTQKSHDG
ncbi:flowering time control protein FPA isoform X1 [Andrographis paniculata]|uniref:flowering time control protein FPA isoform X1 n=1 Tax=Andrographis paniculata TaxID=175694 RepID=UPI0021E876A6|nr:flowering time control protein FPA isoform X1 [Andrographis paniculata]